MKRVSQDTIEQIRARSDIVEVVNSYVPLTRAGAAFKARCPFHNEKTPSFTVNPGRQIFHCFGCGAGGDVFRFVMEREKVDFVNAIRLLARRAGITLEMTEDEQRDASGKDLLYKIHEDVALFYRRILLEHASAAAAREYLKSRRLDEPAAEPFGIGYAPDRGDTLLKWAATKKHPPELLETAGLLLRGDPERGRGGTWYDRFRNRVMFPIRDEQARVIGFSGRVLRKEDSPAKYVNSPETPLFHKSRVLYAIDRARHAIIDAKQAVLCEGQIDTLRCHLAGIGNAVAAQGTAITEDHARILKRYADEVILMLDADSAGQNAALRSVEALLGAGLTVRMASLPAGEDPDSIILKSGPAPVLEALAKAESPVVFQLRVFEQRGELAGEAGRARATRAVLETVAKVPTEAAREAMLKQAAIRLGVSVHALSGDLQRLGRRPAGARDGGDDDDAPAPVERPGDEKALLELLLVQPALVPLARAYLPPAHVSDPVLRRMYESVLRSEGRAGWSLAAEAGDDEEFARLAAQLAMTLREVRGSDFSPERAVQAVILRLWKNALLRRRREAMTRGGEGASALTLQIKALDRGWDAALPVLELGV